MHAPCADAPRPSSRSNGASPDPAESDSADPVPPASSPPCRPAPPRPHNPPPSKPERRIPAHWSHHPPAKFGDSTAPSSFSPASLEFASRDTRERSTRILRGPRSEWRKSVDVAKTPPPSGPKVTVLTGIPSSPSTPASPVPHPCNRILIHRKHLQEKPLEKPPLSRHLRFLPLTIQPSLTVCYNRGVWRLETRGRAPLVTLFLSPGLFSIRNRYRVCDVSGWAAVGR